MTSSELIGQLHKKIHFFRSLGIDEYAEQLLALRGQKVIRNFWQFDDLITVPLHGFKSVRDYYKKCSCRYFLGGISTPTLILHAKDDPFMTAACIPLSNELSPDTQLELFEKGGHVGFVTGNMFNPKYWLECRIPTFLEHCL